MGKLKISIAVISLLAASPAFAQNAKVSTLIPATTPLTGTELFYVVQGGVSKSITFSQFQQSVGSVKNFTVLPGGSGVFTADGSYLLAQSTSLTAATIYNSTLPSTYHSFDVTRSVLDLEPGSTVQNAGAFGAYINNNVAQGTSPNQANAIGLFVSAVNMVAGSATFGLNPACSDAHGAISVVSLCEGAEFDLQANATGSTMQGITLRLQGTAASIVGNGFQVTNTSTGGAQFTNAFVSNAGAAQFGLNLGQLTATSVANTGSQKSGYSIWDSAGAAHAVILQAIPIGTASEFTITDNTLANGVGFKNVPAGNSPDIFPVGSDTNINLTLLPKGAASIIVPTLTINAIPASAGSGGLFVCVDTSGAIYKKATCP